jgi:hypothetical protein
MVARSATSVPEATENEARSTRSVAKIPPVPVKVGVTSATAEEISSGVASRTRRPWEKMQPSSGSSSSQELPFPVVSLV